jgi:hypothetical protein
MNHENPNGYANWRLKKEKQKSYINCFIFDDQYMIFSKYSQPFMNYHQSLIFILSLMLETEKQLLDKEW